MKQKYSDFKIIQLFDVKSGDYHAIDQLDAGNTPLIACGITDNGFVGYYDVAPGKIYERAITVAYNGLPLVTKFHPYRFGAKDDVGILIPKTPMRDSTLFYVAALLNSMTWRYSYGRKCYREKLQNISISLPATQSKGAMILDENAISKIFPITFDEILSRPILSLFAPPA